MTLTSEKRASKRLPKDTPILFTLSQPQSLADDRCESQNATILDISSTGMGIFTTCHISTGQVVNFVKDQPHWELPSQGVVVWSLKHGAGFRVGLEFILA